MQKRMTGALIGMHIELLRQLQKHLLALQRGQGHLRVERRYRLRILSVRQFVQPPYLLVCHHAKGALQALHASSQLSSNREK
jgi:hypothetical protein